MKVALIAKPGHSDSGVGRYVDRLVPALQDTGIEVVLVYPRVPLPSWLLDFFKKIIHWDLQAFFLTYPVWITYPPADLYHFSSQNLACLLIFRRPHSKVIVSVHDIFPFLVQTNRDLNIYRNIFYRVLDSFSMIGLKRADQLIAVSEFTRQMVIESLDVSSIDVIYEGI
jgi:glycosyltransferase involved in cell wall biosynthesis